MLQFNYIQNDSNKDSKIYNRNRIELCNKYEINNNDSRNTRLYYNNSYNNSYSNSHSNSNNNSSSSRQIYQNSSEKYKR